MGAVSASVVVDRDWSSGTWNDLRQFFKPQDLGVQGRPSDGFRFLAVPSKVIRIKIGDFLKGFFHFPKSQGPRCPWERALSWMEGRLPWALCFWRSGPPLQ